MVNKTNNHRNANTIYIYQVQSVGNNKLDFQEGHEGSGPETIDYFGVALFFDSVNNKKL